METLEDQIITLQIKNDELKDEVETITKELEERWIGSVVTTKELIDKYEPQSFRNNNDI